MTPANFSIQRSWLIMPIVAVAMVVLFSCNETKKGKDAKLTTTTPCFSLTKEQIKTAWIDPGHTGNLNPKDNIKFIQFMSTQNPDNSIDVSVQGLKEDGTPIGDPIRLEKEAGCRPDFPKVTVKKNFAELSVWKILKDPTTFSDKFVKVGFMPDIFTAEGGEQVLQFKVTSYSTDTEDDFPSLLPCPPCINCRPPCPANCTPACTTKDSMDIGTFNGIKVRDSASAN